MASVDGEKQRPLAVVTGASSGIGLELAVQCAESGFDLMLAADTPLDEAVERLSTLGTTVSAIEVDLANIEGVESLCEALEGRPVDALLANAGHGLGHAFLDQNFEDILHVIDTNITGTVYLVHRIGREMRTRGQGRILITGSIAGYMPGSFAAVYNASKAFLDSFSLALRDELTDTGVTVTCLIPGVTDTEFFARADLLDTEVGATDNKMDPAEVAHIGFQAMMSGDAEAIAGLKNKLQVAMSGMTPGTLLAKRHRKMAEPGSARR